MRQARSPKIPPVPVRSAPLEPPEETFAVAAIVCAVGLFLRILLSGPVLNMLGIDYGGEDAAWLTKVHPTSYIIAFSFVILVFSKRNPIEQIIQIATKQTAFFTFLVIYVIIIVYWIVRGPRGVGLMFDVHIVAPIAAIVFSFAPKSYCRTIVYLFAGIAILNSAVGVIEAATHWRLFPFDPTWEVLQQDYFRASALMGHPLANAVFTVFSMFIVLSLRMPTFAKSVVFMIMLYSLVAFGGRSALAFGMTGLIILGLINIRHYLRTNNLTVLQLGLAIGAVLIVPVVCGVFLYAVLHSGVGERLLAYNSLNDESADVRLEAFRVFKYINTTDLIFGTDGDKILDIASAVGIKSPTSDIENPWILMFISLGAIMFTLWFCGWLGYIWRLLSGASPAVKIAALQYFAIATTSNSFGRKDLVYAMIAGVVVCVKRSQKADLPPPTALDDTEVSPPYRPARFERPRS